MSLELVKPKSGAGKGAQEQFVLHVPSLATCPDVLAAAIEKLPNCPTEVRLENEEILSSFTCDDTYGITV